jgi:hypothetical protein
MNHFRDRANVFRSKYFLLVIIIWVLLEKFNSLFIDLLHRSESTQSNSQSSQQVTTYQGIIF